MGIGEAVGDVGLEAPGERFVTVEGAVDVAHGAERGLDLCAVENAVAENDRAARFIDEGVGGVVGVGGVETHEDAFTRISFAITVGIANEPKIGGLHDEDAVLEKLESGGAIQAVEERGAFVGFAVAVGILEDNELVLDGGGGGELGRPGPDGDPEAALGVPGELEGFGEFGEFLFAGEDVGFETRREGHFGDGLFGAEELVGAVGVGAGFVGPERRHHRDGDQVDRAGVAGGEGPGLAFVVGGDGVALGHFLHHDLGVGDFGLILDGLVGDFGAVAVDVVAVDGAVAGMPPGVFLGDEGAEFLGRGGVEGGRGRAEEGLEDFGGEGGVAGFAEVNAVDGEGAALGEGGGGEFLGRGEEIDERDAGLVAGDLGHGGGVEGEVPVVGGGDGELGAGELLVGDRGEEDEAGWSDAVVGLGADVVHVGFEILFEFRQALGAGEGFVVAEKDEDDAGLDLGEPLVGGAEIFGASAGDDLVAGGGEIAEGEVMLGEFLGDERLQMVVMLHAVGEGVADDGDALAGVEGDGGVDGAEGRGLSAGSGRRSGGGFFLLGVGRRRRGGGRGAAGGDGLAEGVDGGGELVAVALEAVFARRVRIDEGDVGLGGNGETDGPEDGVDHEAAEGLVFEVGRGAHGGGEDFVLLAARVLEGAGPGDGHRGGIEGLLLFVGGALLEGFGGGVGGVHALEDETAEENLGVGGRVGLVDIAVTEDLGHAAEEGVGGGRGFRDAAGGLGLVFAPVGDPGLAEDVFAEAAGPGGF